MIVRELIHGALILSTVLSSKLEVPNDGQVTDGLRALNGLIGEKSANGQYIPYDGEVQVPSVPGQQDYAVLNLITLDTLTYNIGDVRYSLLPQSKSAFYASARLNNIDSLPGTYYFNRENGRMIFSVYYTPNTAIDYFTVRGSFGLGTVTLDEELDDKFEVFYQRYLLYLLAQEIAMEYDLPFSQAKERKLYDLEKSCLYITPKDFNAKLLVLAGESSNENLAQAIVSPGWTVT